MLKRDYIVRQFEDFGRALALLLNYKKQGDWDKFEEELTAAFAKYAPGEVSEAEQMSDESFELQIINSNTISPEQKKILAALLFEKLDYYASKGQEEEFDNIRRKCLVLYRFLKNNLTENQYDLEVHYRLDFLEKQGEQGI